MASRSRLHSTMEALAAKRQKEFDQQTKWNNQLEYYKNWGRRNTQFQNWTSNEYYASSQDQYGESKKQEMKKETLEARRDKLRKLFFEEEQELDLERYNSPRFQKAGHSKMNQTPTEVLKDLNIGIKLAEDDRKRHEAELKLYHQWRNENPIIKEHENAQGKVGLKLAWLDQQIEKRMEQEKTEEETKRMIEERDRLMKREQELDKLEIEERTKREAEMMKQLEIQMQHFKIKDEYAARLKRDEELALMKKIEIEDFMIQRTEDINRRKQNDIALFNINQSKVKLRKKALDVEEQLKKERKMIEEIIESQTVEEIECTEKRKQTKEEITSFLNYVRDQQKLEEQRQKYISFIFDSEAKNMWDKQERQWREEQEARDKLLNHVLATIKEQITEKINKNVNEQQQLVKDREEILQNIEETNVSMRTTLEDMQQKTIERKMELDKQINDKELIEREQKLIETKKREEELENIRKEEDRLKHELTQMQHKRHFPQSGPSRRIIW